MLRQSLQKYSSLKQAHIRSKSSKAGTNEKQENCDPNLQKSHLGFRNQPVAATPPGPRHVQLLAHCPPTSWYSPPVSLGSNGTPILFGVKKTLLRTPLSDLGTGRNLPADNDNNVKVVVRIRPPNDASGGQTPLAITNKECIALKAGNETQQFTFDYIADGNTSQETFFKAIGRPMVENCLAGYNSSVFAFGQTGSGKTYTMLGPVSSLDANQIHEQGGLVPRIFTHLFARIEEAENAKRVGRELRFLCKVSLLEIYQEVVTDLLNPAATRLVVREDIRKGTYVDGLSEEAVSTVGEVVNLLHRGLAHRKVAETKMNPESSRSHLLLRCTVESKCIEDGVTSIRTARLDLVDLAGSERQKMTESEGERLREATSINLSLSALGLVIRKLVAGEPHIPYRDSKLTFLMQDSLGGNAKTVFIATVSPEMACAKETNTTLKFAQRAKQIRNKAVINEDTDGEATLLLQENARLREELEAFKALHLALSPSSVSGGSPAATSEVSAKTSDQLAAALSLNQALELRLAQLQEQNMQLKRERDNLDLIQQQAHAQMALLVEAQLDARQVEDADASKAHAQVCEQLAAAERKMDVISRGRDAAKAERSQLEAKVAELEVRLANADSVVSSLQQSLTEEQQRCADAETEVDALARKCDCLQLVGKDLEGQVSGLALECENLHQALGELQRERADLRGRLSTAEDAAEALSKEARAHRAGAAQAQREADAAQAAASTSQSALDTATAAKCALEDEVAALTKQLTAAASQLSVARAERDEALQDAGRSRASLTLMLEEREGLRSGAAAAAERTQQLELALERSAAALRAAEAQLAQLLEEVSGQAAQREALAEEASARREELGRLRGALEACSGERDQLAGELAAAGQTVAQLTEQLEQSDRAAETLEAKMNHQVSTLTQQLAESRREAHSTQCALQAQVVQLEGRLAVLKAQALTLSSQAVEHEKVSLKLAGALQDTSTKLGAAAAQVEQAERMKTASELRKSTAIAQFGSARAQAHCLALAAAVLHKDVRALRCVNNAAEAKVGALSRSSRESSAALQSATRDLSRTRSKNAELQEALRSAIARAKEADVNMREMEEEMIRQDEVLNQCRTEIGQWQTQFAKLNLEIAEKSELLRDAREHAAGAAATAASAEQRSAELLQRVSDLEGVALQRVTQLEDLQLRLDAKEHECREHRAAMSAQIGNAEARERSLAKVNSLLSAMNAKVSAMRLESERHKAEMNDSRLNVISLQRALSEKEQELDTTCRLVKALQGQLAQHESSHGDLTKTILQNQAERSEDRTRIESLEHQLGDCKRELLARAQEMADVKFKALGTAARLQKQLALAVSKASSLHHFVFITTGILAAATQTIEGLKEGEVSRCVLENELRSRMEAAEAQARQLEETALHQGQLLDQATADLELERTRVNEERAQAQERTALLLEERQAGQAEVDGLRQAVEAAREAAEDERAQAQERIALLLEERQVGQAEVDGLRQAVEAAREAAEDEHAQAEARLEALCRAKADAEARSQALQDQLLVLQEQHDRQEAEAARGEETWQRTYGEMSALHAEATARNIELQGRLAGLEEALHMHDCLVEQLEREKGVSAAHVDEKLALQERLQEMERQAVQPEELVADLRSQAALSAGRRLLLPSRELPLRAHLATVQQRLQIATSVHVMLLALLFGSLKRGAEAQARQEHLRQAFADANAECGHLAKQVRGRDTHILHLEQRLAESASREGTARVSPRASQSSHDEASRRDAPTASDSDIITLLRSLRHDSERNKAAALLDQRERYEAELAVAAGKERSVREERDILLSQQQQQLAQIEALQESLKSSKSAHEGLLRELRAMTAERNLAVEQLTQLQDVVEEEQCLHEGYGIMEHELEKSKDIVQRLLEQVAELEKSKAANERLLATFKATVEEVRTQRDHAMHMAKHPARFRRHRLQKIVKRWASSRLPRPILRNSSAARVKHTPLKMHSRSPVPWRLSRAFISPPRLGFGFLEPN